MGEIRSPWAGLHARLRGVNPLLRWLAPGLCALVCAGAPLSAQTYSARLNVADTGNSYEGLIDPADIAIGDSFNITFELDPFANQTAGDGTTAEFNGSVFSYNITPNAGNTGVFTPMTGVDSAGQMLFSQDLSDSSKTYAILNITFSDGGNVNYTATGVGIENNLGSATFTALTFAFLIDQPFTYVNNGMLADYVDFLPMTPTGNAYFFFSPPDLDQGDVQAEGPASVPEPGT